MLTSSFSVNLHFECNLSEALSATDLSVLISSLGDLGDVVGAVSLELPLEVVHGNGGAANGGASKPNLIGGIHGQFLSPNDSAESRVSVDYGRRYVSAIFLEVDGDNIKSIRCQEHLKVDGISTLNAELGEGFSDVGNGEGCRARGHVVRYDLHVVEVSN